MSKNTKSNDQRIAITGISAILPGGENINECWETIRAGLDKVSELPNNRVDVTAYYNPEKGVKDKIYCKRGGFIPDFDFDAREFGMNMFQVEDADTNQTLTLLKVKEALEDAGVEAFSKEKKNIGVVLGIGGGQKASNEFYSRMNYVVVDKVLRKMGLPEKDIEVAVDKFKANFPEWRLDSFPGFLGNVTAGRCTNVFNLSGMNCVVDAACASSLIALKVAIDELLHGDCDEMICGATCTDNSIGMYMAFSKTPVFSTDDSLTAYDKDTKGMLIGEGSVMLHLKRYEDAVRDGNQIHGIIRGVASSSDGRASGIYSPTVSGQELAIQRAYQKAGVNPGDVTLVEGHGTGTPVGDRIELTALKNVFQEHCKSKEQIAVGSIKSQIGHLKAVAGLAGLVKVVMALKHKVLPASINVKIPPVLYDDTKIQDSPLYINTSLRPWFTPGGKPRYAGISSFGFGGANYHCVLEEAEPEQTKPYRMHDVAVPVILFAPSLSALKRVVDAEIGKLQADATYKSLQSFRKANELKSLPAENPRVGFVCANIEQTLDCLKQISDKLQKDGSESWTLLRQGCFFRSKSVAEGNNVAALFSGQGSQYTNMFSEVANNWPQFRETVKLMDKQSESICGIATSKILYPRKRYENETPADESEISTVQNAQITTTACSLGAYRIFEDAGFKPAFAAGHSLGEFAALYASKKVVSLDQVLNVVTNRAKIMGDSNSNRGSMIAVIGKGASDISITNRDVWMANCNSPDQVVLSGDKDAIAKETSVLESRFKVVKLNVGDAYHTPLMEPANSKFKSCVGSLKSENSSIKLFSNVSGSEYNGSVSSMLGDHMTSSVQFINQINNMYAAGARVFVEFGPRATLAKLVENILKNKSDVFVVSVNPSNAIDSDKQLREAAMKLSVLGVNLSNFDPWGVDNVFKLKEGEKKKTVLRLSAATYVSSKTLKEREKLMNDGRVISGSGFPAAKASVNDSLANEVALLKKQNLSLQNEVSSANSKVEALKKKLESLEEAADNMSYRSSAMEMNTLLKHRQLISSLLSEYNKIIETTSVIDPSELESKFDNVKDEFRDAAPKSSGTVDSALLKRAENVVLDVLAEKTGYDVEMIDQDMELETELGIDSIKRVEILSEVQTVLGIQATDVDALSRTRTVGEVITAMKAEISSASPPAAPQASKSAATQISTRKPAPVSTVDLSRAKSVVLEVLAEKTGYDADMIEADMELETELGIDSIKRVEILSEVQSQLNIEAKDVDALSRTRTVKEVIEAIEAELQPNSTSPEAIPSSKPTSSASVAFAKDIVMQVLADKTGYEIEMIEPDMELETELGIDSIKRVEILSEVQNNLQITAKDVDALSRTRTVGEVVAAMEKEISGGVSVSPVVERKPVPIAAPVSNSISSAKAADAVIQVIADKTGYEVSMIELDMELETELGIDSIKRVEILSEVQSTLGVEAKDVDALSRTRTVGEVIAALNSELSGASPAPISTKSEAKTGSSASSEEAKRVVMQVLAEKTGYDFDMIEDDMELETELGIDSIKRVEILSEVQNILNVEAQNVDALSRTRTVAEVISAMQAEIQGSKPTASSVTVEPVAQTKVSNDNLKAAEEAVISVIAEKTGYDVEMIEEDMELETELGIDSIKRVEILSEVQNQLGIEAKNVDALSRSRTVGEVICALREEVSPKSLSAPVVAKVSAPAPVQNKGNSNAAENAEKVVLEVLAEKTGYDVEMLENDMELETELGIDSIKRVEILSEVQSVLNVEAKDVDALSRTRTVGEVVEAMRKELGNSNTSVSPSSTSTNSFVYVNSTTSSNGNAESAVLEVIAEKTGYDVEMIEHDMELETELGIDSIKRVEILSEVQNQLKIEAKDVDALSRTRTVGDVIAALKLELSSSSLPKASVTSEVSFATSTFDHNNYSLRSRGCEDLNLSCPVVVEAEAAPILSDLKLAKICVCAKQIPDGLTSLLEKQFQAKVTSFDNSGTEATLQEKLQSVGNFSAFVYIHNDEPIENALICSKFIRKQMVGDSRKILFCLNGDGKLGYEQKLSSVANLEKYALCGLAKTVSLEWPEVQARVLDSDLLTASQIASELGDPNRAVKETGYSGDKRYNVVVKGLTENSVTHCYSAEDVWLVSGGARGITPLCIREFAKLTKGGQFLLMGRSSIKPIPGWAKSCVQAGNADEKNVQKAAIEFIKSKGEKPKPSDLRKLVSDVLATVEIEENVRAIGSYCNGKVEYVSCDINNKSDVERCISSLRNKGLKINGLFHASGVLRDKLIEAKSIDDFKLVYDTKVRGFDNLLTSIGVDKLRNVVLFSSLAGFYGNAGQSDYSMANEVLNRLAHALSKCGVNAKAFDFGPWDGGMVTPALKKHFVENGVQIIPREAGATSVGLMMLNSKAEQILVGNWGLAPTKPKSTVNTIDVAFSSKDFLKDHMIQGKLVVPFTFILDEMVQQVLGLYTGFYLSEVVTCKLFRGLKFDAVEPINCRLTVEETSKDKTGIKVTAKLSTKDLSSGKFVPSYQAELVLSTKPAKINSQVAVISDQGAKMLSENDLYQESKLFHGPAFQAIEKINLVNDTKIIAKLNLTKQQFQGLKIERIILDCVFQAGIILGFEQRQAASLPAHLDNVKFSSDLFNGSRSFGAAYLVLNLKSAKSDMVWKFDFTFQQQDVLCQGQATLTLNSTLSYK